MPPQHKRVAGAIIQNKQGEFLLQQRGSDAPSFPLCWTMFGGIMEDVEEPHETLLRELEEELELNKEYILQCELFVQQFQENGTEQFIFHIITNVSVDNLTLHEGAQMKYLAKNQLFNREFAFNAKAVLESFVQTL